MYSSKPESKEAVSVTSDRKGNNPVKLLLVEMEEALNAGHRSDPSSDMQLWAMVLGRVLASNAVRSEGAVNECAMLCCGEPRRRYRLLDIAGVSPLRIGVTGSFNTGLRFPCRT